MTDPWPESYDFDRQVTEWGGPPVGGVNISTKSLLEYPQDQLRAWVEVMEREQYRQPSNASGLYRQYLGLDDTTGKTVMDFGCGFGMDALQYARAGNKIILADINESNLFAAQRVLKSFGYHAKIVAVRDRPPFFLCPNLESDGCFDIFHASGVLHHTPDARIIMRRASELMSDDGEVRLMLYSDRTWTWATGLPPFPIDKGIRWHPEFKRYVRRMDAVGFYADWYSREKLERLVDGFLKVTAWNYLQNDAAYCVARLIKEKP